MQIRKLDDSVINLFHRAEDYFSTALCRRHMEFDSAASAYCSDVNDSPLNTLVVKHAVSSLEALLDQASDFFLLTQTPWCVVLRADLITPDSLNTLKNFGFMPHEQSVAMFLSLDEFCGSSVNEYCFQNMDNRLSEWIIPERAFPASNENVPLQYKKSHELALARGKNLTHLSLFENNQIVSSLTLSWLETCARIDDLATDPEFQGKGFATRLMIHALSIAREKKAHLCFLEASPKGLSIYQKIGFKPLFQNQVFLKQGLS